MRRKPVHGLSQRAYAQTGQGALQEEVASASRRRTGAIGNLFRATTVAAILAIILYGEGILPEARSLALLTQLLVAHHLKEDPSA